MIDDAHDNLYAIRTLDQFQHIDDEDNDVGLNVRQRSQAIVRLLKDRTRLREEREAARKARNKYGGVSSSQGFGSDDYRAAQSSGGSGGSYSARRDSYRSVWVARGHVLAKSFRGVASWLRGKRCVGVEGRFAQALFCFPPLPFFTRGAKLNLRMIFFM